jgi:hypothetical protein
MRVRSQYLLFGLVTLAFLISYFFPGVSNNDTIQTSISFIGILFGIIIGFFITDLYTRFHAIRSNAAIDSSCLTTYFSFCNIILSENANHKKWFETQRELIYNYVKKFIPLPWEKYEKTEKEFSEIVNSLQDLKYKTDKENETYSNMLSVISQHSDAREKLVMYGKDTLSKGEWMVILSLGGLLLASLFYVKDASLASTIFTGSISSSILLLLFVVRDLNNLNFGESSVSIGPYERVLEAIGKPKFYADKFKDRRFKIINKK